MGELETIVKKTKNKYIENSMIAMIFVCLFFSVFDRKDIYRGFILGGFFSIINFSFLSYFIYLRIKNLTFRFKKTTPIVIGIIIRYINISIPLLLSIRCDKINVFGTIIGLLTIQLSILFDYASFFVKKFFR